MRANSCWIIALLTLFSCHKAVGQQDSLARNTQVFTEVGAQLTSGQYVPFWQRANQFGTVPLTGSFGTLRFGIASDYRPQKSRRVDWGYGLEVVGNAGPSSQVILPQAYVKARLGKFEIYAGRRRNIIGLVDTLLTSGSYAMSGNALPLPTIQIGTQGFIAVPFTKGLLSINATFGHAWFETENRKVYNTYLHQSTFYMRFGKPSWAVRFYGGINHQVVWGGYSPYLSSTVSNNGYLPSNVKAFLYAVVALRASDLSVDGNVTSFDETNRIGNHLGSLDLGAEFDIGNSSIMIYRQNPYDTGAIFYLTTIADGLNGVSVRRKQRGTSFISVDRGLFEFLYTENQGGNQFVLDDPQRRGKVNYFNSSQYIDGWTTHRQVIGTPFLTPGTEVRPGLPNGAIANNRVSMLHLGLSGHIGQEATWLLKLSNSQNLGTYNEPFPNAPKQFSGLLQVSAPVQLPVLGDVRISASGALDSGTLLAANATGLYIGLRKTWNSTPSAARSTPVQTKQKATKSPRYW